jgi:adenylate cyclase class 2
MNYREIEVRFLEIDKDNLIENLTSLGAEDLGEKLLNERIVYDRELTWRDQPAKMVRLRTVDGTTELAYKNRQHDAVDGTEEIEFSVSDADAAEALLERLGYVVYRYQEKKRHTFKLGNVVVDIDTWPRVPTYVELEGHSEQDLKEVAQQLGLDWDAVELRNPRKVIEEVYKIPVGKMKWFTFDRFE